jgi:hypothetical protein
VVTGEIMPWIDKLLTYITDPVNNEDPEPYSEGREPYSKRHSAGGIEMTEHKLVNKNTKRQKTHHNQNFAHNMPTTHATPTTATLPSHTTNTRITKTQNPQIAQHTPNTKHTYHLRSKLTHKHNSPLRKRKQTTHKVYNLNTPITTQKELTHTPIKRSSAAQAPPRINMAFPAPCTMPFKPPTLPSKHHQSTIERFFTKAHSHLKPRHPTNTTRNKNNDALDKDNTNKSYRHPAIKAVTFNTRGMHNTILDIHRILSTDNKPTIISLTETKHSHIKSIWRDILKEYKLIHTPPKLDPTTLRRSAGTILAIRRDTYKEAIPIQTPTNLTDYIKAAKITPHDGTPIIAITAYMPQLHTKAQEQIYQDILKWVENNIIQTNKDTTILMGGDFQASPAERDDRSHYPPLTRFCDSTGLIHLNPSHTYTYIPARTHIDHWLILQPTHSQPYTPHNTNITTHTPEYGDHMALALDLPQIGDIQSHKSERKLQNPTTRSHPPFLLPIPQNLIDQYRLGNEATSDLIQHATHTTKTLLISSTTTKDQIDKAASNVMTLLHTYHDIATKIWPMQETRQESTPNTTLRPPISRAGIRQIGRLAKLRNECNTTIKQHPEITTDPNLNPPHINQKIIQILQPDTPITTKEAQQQCSKAIGTIIRKASQTLTDKLRLKENNRYDKSPKHYHNNLKINAGINPRARDQPRVTALTHPITNKLQTTPQEVISIVTSHYELEQKRATPEQLPAAPWTQPQHPDNFTRSPGRGGRSCFLLGGLFV